MAPSKSRCSSRSARHSKIWRRPSWSTTRSAEAETPPLAIWPQASRILRPLDFYLTQTALDKAYGTSDWLAGGALSMADLFVAPILAGVERMPDGAALLGAVPNVRRAQATLRLRASFTSTDPSVAPA
ncbi:MAG: glutathione S-transferase domain-containing protein [Rubrivivax sp.]